MEGEGILMEKLTNVEMILFTHESLSTKEVLDVGGYYYILNGKNVRSIKKSDVGQIRYENKKSCNDSSKYVKQNE